MPLFAFGSTTITWAETYRGKVVDAQTGEPLEGAVIAIVWYKKPVITMNGPQYFHSAKEGFTDSNGEFSVDGSPGIDWNPLTYIKERPYIAIFKPGYGPFPTGYFRERPTQEIEKALVEEGAVIRMPALRTEQEKTQYGSPTAMRIPPDIPYEEIPNLIRLINVHRKSLGFSPIGKPIQ